MTNHSPPQGVELYTMTQAAEALKIPRRALPAIFQRNGIPLIELGPRSRRVASTHLNELVARCVKGA